MNKADNYVSLKEHVAALRKADHQWLVERDRRYAAERAADAAALAIKELADKEARGLARDIQTYKDEKANELREQISSERGLYSTKSDMIAAVEKFETALKPLNAFIAGEQARAAGANFWWFIIFGLIAATGTFIAITAAVIGLVMYLT